ncbi:hypothetical protein J7I44_14260 [Frateuria sp. MAH-13]|uniref:Glycosyltransferase RgtA/B/C/D-like domain-containing protein n=1 Tax=Frateuria flava TaxID=2821489 RepID=A0ABS4DQY6_9GAMM|nr:hypothetical protein [Frateuria flava]MBP1475474.1 hypothetical protein [Frateuria flava]
MTRLLFEVAICVVGLSLVGYPLTRHNPAIKGAERLPWALILGICTTIVLVRSVNAVAPIGQASPWIAAGLVAWLVYSWRDGALRDLFFGDLRALDPIMSAVWLTALVVLTVALNIPVFSHKALVAEASSNHDAIYYVTNARWMLGHRFGDTVTYSADHPLFWMARSAFGAAPSLGRVGAEGLLAFVSAISAQDPVTHFLALQTVAVIGGTSASALLIPRRLALFSSRPTAAKVLAAGSVVFAPALVQIFINSSFANAYGVVLMTSFVLISIRSKAWSLRVQQPLLFAGMLATYPELSPIALIIIGSIFLFELLLRGESFRELLMSGFQILASVAIAIVAVPWISSVAAMTLKTVYFVASTQGNSWPDPYAGLSALQLPLAVFSTSQGLATIVPGAFFVAFAGLLCITLARSTVRSPDSSLPLGVALALTVFLSYIFHKEFNYGKLKILEYFSLFLAPSLIAACGVATSGGKHEGLHRIVQHLAILGVAAMNIGACYLLLQKGSLTAGRRYVANDLVNAVKAADQWSGQRSVAVRFGSEPFLYSMWTAYFSNRPLEFSAVYGSGGYLEPFVSTHPAVPRGSSQVMITDAIGGSTLLGEKILARYGRFEVVDVTDGTRISGLYGDEGGWSWMGRKLLLNIVGQGAKFLNLVLANRFAPAAASEKVAVTVDGARCELTISTEPHQLTLAIPPGHEHQVTIVPLGPVRSPALLGQSVDTRELSYQVSGLSLSINPRFPTLTCRSEP